MSVEKPCTSRNEIGRQSSGEIGGNAWHKDNAFPKVFTPGHLRQQAGNTIAFHASKIRFAGGLRQQNEVGK
jgi:hypothetical protein